MSIRISSLLLTLLLVIAASTGAQTRRAPPPPVFTAKQTAQIERLVANIKRASRDSLAKDDWSLLASLYPSGTFSCWVARNSEKAYSFLSMPGIPDNARHALNPTPSTQSESRKASTWSFCAWLSAL